MNEVGDKLGVVLVCLVLLVIFLGASWLVCGWLAAVP